MHADVAGGGFSSRSRKFSYTVLSPYDRFPAEHGFMPDDVLCFVRSQDAADLVGDNEVAFRVPLNVLSDHLPVRNLRAVARKHGIGPHSAPLETITEKCNGHVCDNVCAAVVCVFERGKPCIHGLESVNFDSSQVPRISAPLEPSEEVVFPPRPLTPQRCAELTNEWRTSLSPATLAEGVCSVCARLMPASAMRLVDASNPILQILLNSSASVARAERVSFTDPIVGLQGPLLCEAGICKDRLPVNVKVCGDCFLALDANRLPTYSLANGQWLGDVPEVLLRLNVVEKMMISLYRHNACVARVRQGQRKMVSNAVMFAQPVAQLQKVLPPLASDIKACLAVVFIGPGKPTVDDYYRTQFVVRKQYVVEALEWLKLNHKDYAETDIDLTRLDAYPDAEPAGVFSYCPGTGKERGENVPVHDDDEQDGTETGMCPFTVQGLSSDMLPGSDTASTIAELVLHLKEGREVLAVGRSSHPESIYHNPLLFPGMFPWLFPYGLGGMENDCIKKRLDRKPHLIRLLRFFDHRFERDFYFPFLVLNHTQIRDSSRGGYLVTKRHKFQHIASSIRDLDPQVLRKLIQRGASKKTIRPENADELKYFELLDHIDHISGRVQGSTTSKKYCRHEIHSLIYEKGMPVFFITFSPVDVKSPICLFLCGEKLDLSCDRFALPAKNERLRLIADNPAACSRFFHLMVETFIQVILRPGKADGLFGPHSAHYGMVEEQGRLTLHLHLLLWVKGCKHPQFIREGLLKDEDDFKQRLFTWLESIISTEFVTGPLEQVKLMCEDIDGFDDSGLSNDPCCALPTALPSPWTDAELQAWTVNYDRETDRTVYCSNVHKHNNHCRTEVVDECKARFPRPYEGQTRMENNTGALILKQIETLLNNHCRLLSSLMRCNHDVTPLISGTQVRAIMVYITEYITKTPLRTHNIFEAVRTVFDKRQQFLDASDNEGDVARKLLTRVVNSLIAKQQIGGPLACHFIQGFPDHYTSEEFKVCHWKSFVGHVTRAWSRQSLPEDDTENVILRHTEEQIVSYNRLQDYVYRPFELEHWSLYEFVRFAELKLMPPRRKQDAYRFLNGLVNGIRIPRPPLLLHHKHPNVITHDVRLLSKETAKTVTLVGGSLPRKDGDDFEEYAKVMLVLFNPTGWRSGLELKEAEEDWSSAFRRTRFSCKALEVMQNFHALYECRDERHDFAAKRRQTSDLAFPSSVVSDEVDRLDEDAYVEEQLRGHEKFSSQIMSVLTEASSEMRGRMRRVMEEMNDMRHLFSLIHDDSDRQIDPVCMNVDEFDFPRHDRATWKRLLTRARDEVIESRLPKYAPSGSQSSLVFPSAQSKGVVRIIEPSHLTSLSRSYVTEEYASLTPTDLVEEIANAFSLNAEQRRAYGFTARDILYPSVHRLRLILTGMAGTGKSRVIKALMALLAARKESHRFVVMAPTGSAAALVNGSTYHSVLAFGHDCKVLSSGMRDRLRKRLEHVDLFFLDEMSMISCRELSAISRRLSEIFGNMHLSFGGKTMILAGDFAQLPPISKNGPPLYSSKVGWSDEALSPVQEQDALGKAIWFEFCHVVILRQNMRQTGMSDDDIKFRTVLENLRYAHCSKEDLVLLHSRVLSDTFPASILEKPEFKYVSVLTGLNSHRDAINEVKSTIFARDHNVLLQDLYSVDRWNVDKYLASLPPASRERQLVSVKNMQRYLWKLPPSVTSHSAGILRICLGMPVMLKHNEATEVCATNGAEGRIVGFHNRQGLHGKNAVDTLFVELINPPKNVQIEDLPLNVVPVNPSTKTISCPLGTPKSFFNVRRQQVEVLPNFAMSDYCSQGRTRPYNVVDLTTCRSHQSIYTCLSRGASLEGTVIIQQFSDRLLTCGASSDLRTEFKELEILDYLTELAYTKRLPANVPMTNRRAAVDYYINAVGDWYMPPKAHKALVDKNLRPKKRAGELPDLLACEDPVHRRPPPPQRKRMFVLAWDYNNWSCAYDSVMFVIWSLIEDNVLTLQLLNANTYNVEGSSLISRLLTHKTTGTDSMRAMFDIREYWRIVLNTLHPQQFPRFGQQGAAVSAILEYVFRHRTPVGDLKKTCVACNSRSTIHAFHSLLWPAPLETLTSVARDGRLHTTDIVEYVLGSHNIGDCALCHSPNSVWNYTSFSRPPEVILLEFNPDDLVPFLLIVDRLFNHHGIGTFQLAGIIYLGGYHFSARTVRENSVVWKHDGTQNQGFAFSETVDSEVVNLSEMDNRRVNILLYKHIANP